MPTYIALLRGINVSGKNMIKMNELLIHLSSLNFKNIRTYIQSGNIIFESDLMDENLLEKSIHEKILSMFGFDVPVLVKNADAWKKVHNSNPFILERNEDIDKLHVTFLSDIPNQEFISKLVDYKDVVDEFILDSNIVYICCHNGYGKTKLNNTFFESKLKVSATTRNWKTVIKLMEML